jgi:hypothetical protein
MNANRGVAFGGIGQVEVVPMPEPNFTLPAVPGKNPANAGVAATTA